LKENGALLSFYGIVPSESLKLVRSESTDIDVVYGKNESNVGFTDTILVTGVKPANKQPDQSDMMDVDVEGEASPKTPNSSWNCSKCTFLNVATAQTCDVCGSPKGAPVTGQKRKAGDMDNNPEQEDDDLLTRVKRTKTKK